jgi:GTPase SAR1 family protein
VQDRRFTNTTRSKKCNFWIFTHCFLLVLTDENSFLEVKNLWEQIKKVRPNILDVPCVIVGNNLDEENARQVETFDALNWACSENLGGCFG